MKILLVEPRKSRKYHTPYPPVGLLKLSSFHKRRGDEVLFVRGLTYDGDAPDLIYITSLFTYAYEPVHEAIIYYANTFKKTRICVGGIYASLCADNLKEIFGDRIEIFKGLLEETEDILPDYSLVPDWDTSIIVSTRGCIRKCSYCSVPLLEPVFSTKKTIKHLIYPTHKKITLWDNNILASDCWKDIFEEIRESKKHVDFNQGLDARLIDADVVEFLKSFKVSIIRMAYDTSTMKKHVKNAINLLKVSGIRTKNIMVYCLYNFNDSPFEFFERIRDLMGWGVVCYPMRYEPLKPIPKNSYVSPGWTVTDLEMVADARRVIGYGGAFIPHEGLKKKFYDAKTFSEAFSLRPIKS
ncbi:MAG: hypothetical protein SVO01_12555 [Thermotogota bacterium]|nr:hypothetical protein [Thermotogota bacterium]